MFESHRELILENIDYGVLASDPHVNREQLDEIVDLVLSELAYADLSGIVPAVLDGRSVSLADAAALGLAGGFQHELSADACAAACSRLQEN